jgi:hypothetical protein
MCPYTTKYYMCPHTTKYWVSSYRYVLWCVRILQYSICVYVCIYSICVLICFHLYLMWCWMFLYANILKKHTHICIQNYVFSAECWYAKIYYKIPYIYVYKLCIIDIPATRRECLYHFTSDVMLIVYIYT